MNQFRPILRGVAALAGVDVQEIPDHFFRSVRDLATTRLGWVWDAAQFPETVATVAVAFTSGVAAVPTGYQFVIEVFDGNPDETLAVDSLPFIRTGDNIRCSRAGTSTCYVRLKKTAPVLEGDVYDATSTYVTGDQCYYLHSFWTFSGTWVAQVPGTDAEWTEVTIPARLNAYVKYGTLADILRTRGAVVDEVNGAEALADGAVDLELTKLNNGESQFTKTKILTR